MLQFPQKLAFIDSPDPVKAFVTAVKPDVVENVKQRLSFFECMTPAQRARYRHELAVVIAEAVLALSK